MPQPATTTPTTESRDEVTRAWELCYLDPLAARDFGRGLALCDEVHAILLRRSGDPESSARLQLATDERGTLGTDPMSRFIAHNSRAITAKQLGRVDESLHHFYAASEAANVTALGNLGGYHQELHNLEDARQLCEQALRLAREAGARPMVATSAANLIVIHHAAGEPEQARAMAEFMIRHPEELMPNAREQHALYLALGHLSVGEIDAAEGFLPSSDVGNRADGDSMTCWAWLKARCRLARGDAAGAHDVAENALQERQRRQLRDRDYDLMELHRVAADACEALGDAAAALDRLRQAHSLYEQLVGRSARARLLSLQVSHQLAQAQRERDLADDRRRSAEDDRRRLSELNTALHAQIAQTEMLHARLREQALRDPLTGLHNRRYLFEIAPGMLELARRCHAVVLFADLRGFTHLSEMLEPTAVARPRVLAAPGPAPARSGSPRPR